VLRLTWFNPRSGRLRCSRPAMQVAIRAVQQRSPEYYSLLILAGN